MLQRQGGGGCPGLPFLIVLMVSVDVKLKAALNMFSGQNSGAV